MPASWSPYNTFHSGINTYIKSCHASRSPYTTSHSGINTYFESCHASRSPYTSFHSGINTYFESCHASRSPYTTFHSGINMYIETCHANRVLTPPAINALIESYKDLQSNLNKHDTHQWLTSRLGVMEIISEPRGNHM